MSVPLLLERSLVGVGPQVPIKDEYDVLVVEGLAEGCLVEVNTGTARHIVRENGRIDIRPTAKGMVAQAKLEGCGSKVHVWLEKSNG